MIGKAKSGAPTYFQMGSSLPDKLYNLDKSGKSTRNPGIRDTDKIKKKRKKVTKEAFYHGTTTLLEPGDEILPPAVTGRQAEKGRLKNLDKVFMTKDVGSAKVYAGRAKHSLGGQPAVYLVEPEGDLQIINSKPGTTVIAAQKAKIIKKVL